MKYFLSFLVLTVGLMTNDVVDAADLSRFDPENLLYLDIETGEGEERHVGRVVINMRPDQAPNHVARVKELVRQGFYDGIIFHRVIEGFMAQTGDPDGLGTGGSGQNIDAEFNDVPHFRGAVAMARAGDPNSADSQFFIVFRPSFHLDGEYTNWGRVVDGMVHVDALPRGEPPMEPGKIVKMQVAADAE